MRSELLRGWLIGLLGWAVVVFLIAFIAPRDYTPPSDPPGHVRRSLHPWRLTLIKEYGLKWDSYGLYPSKEECEKAIEQTEREQNAQYGYCHRVQHVWYVHNSAAG